MRSAGQRRLLLLLTLVLCLGMTWLTWAGGDQVSQALQDNLLRLRLERVFHTEPPRGDADLLGLLGAHEFVTQNPRVAWLGGYYVYSQTFAPAAAQALWAMAPDYVAAQLLVQARTTPDKGERLQAATAAAALAPASLPVQLAYVDALVANEHWPDAAAAAERLLAAWPAEADVNALAGWVAWRSGGSPEQARTLLERAMTLDPANLRTPGYLTEYLGQEGQPGEQEAFLRQALQGNQTPALNAGFYTELARIYISEGDLAAAWASLHAALGLDPQNWWINGIAGDYSLHTGQYAQAIDYYTISLSQRLNPDFLVGLGDAYWAQGERERARAAYCEATKLVSHHALALERLAQNNLLCP